MTSKLVYEKIFCSEHGHVIYHTKVLLLLNIFLLKDHDLKITEKRNISSSEIRKKLKQRITEIHFLSMSKL